MDTFINGMRSRWIHLLMRSVLGWNDTQTDSDPEWRYLLTRRGDSSATF